MSEAAGLHRIVNRLDEVVNSKNVLVDVGPISLHHLILDGSLMRIVPSFSKLLDQVDDILRLLLEGI